MNAYDYRIICSDGSTALCHHGIKGMKWGVRRYQNEDGSLTSAGRERYGRIASRKPNLTTMISRGTGAAVATGFTSGGILGGVVGGIGGAAVGYAAYRTSKKRYDNAVKKLKDDDARKQKEYEQSEEYQQFLKKLQSEGARLNAGGADSYQSQRNKDMVSSFREAEWHKSEWAQSHGLNSPKAVSEYVKKALKNFNENDPDQIVYQHMDKAILMRDNGYISKKTFAKLYDGQLAEDAFDFANYGDSDWLDRWHDADQKK